MFDKKDSEKVHFLIPCSRILFGVCDPTERLRPNECHVRITIEGDGVHSLEGAWVIVARNPCLHPGDIRKLRVRRIPELDRLVDCIVFPITGNVPPPSMMSGGDLDGDKFFVCWDEELIPTNIHEPHFYPAAKEKPRHAISHDDLVRYFARYNNASLGRVKNLYLDWVRVSDKGAACEECLELNHLFSCCVDGERIIIPDKLLHPPPQSERSKPFVIDKLTKQVTSVQGTLRFGLRSELESLDIDIIEFLAAADDICMSEFELFQLVCNWADMHDVSMARFVDHFDFGAFTADQKA
jgi:RNA dependent RNA polymerase